MLNNFESKEHDPMIPNYLLNDSESKPIILIDIPFCNENEIVSKLFKKLKFFSKEKFDFKIVWKTKNQIAFPHWRRKTQTLLVKPMRESALVRKITYVKPKEMLLLVGISMKIQTKIQNQLSISFNILILFSMESSNISTNE